MNEAQEQFQEGLKELAEAGDNPRKLGTALVTIHGALEECFRNLLQSDSRISPEDREQLKNNKMGWVSIANLMEQHHDLSRHERSRILDMNRLRQNPGHGRKYEGTRKEIEQYVPLVRNFINKYSIANNSQTSSYQSNTNNFAAPPFTAYNHYSHGHIKLHKNDFVGAIEYFTKAIDLNPKFTDAYTNRGLAKEKRGDIARAIADYKQAIAINPTDNTAYNHLHRLTTSPKADFPSQSNTSNQKSAPSHPDNIRTSNAQKSSKYSPQPTTKLSITKPFKVVVGYLSKISIASRMLAGIIIPSILFYILIYQQTSNKNNPSNNNADQILRDAASKCDLELAKIALREGGKPNAINDGFFSSKETALTNAVKTSHFGDKAKKTCLPVIKLLLDKKADPNLQGSLHLAAQNANLDVIKLLLKRGANPKLDFEGKGAPLLQFVKSHKYQLDTNSYSSEKVVYDQVLLLLLSPYTSNINRQDKHGDTLLIQLIKNDVNSVFILQKIIKLGANTKQKNKEGKTAYDYAFAKNLNPNVIKLLNKYR